MNRAQKYFLHLPKGTHFEKIIDTEYGKENIYVSPDGKKHSIPMIPDTISWETKIFENCQYGQKFTNLVIFVPS